MQEELALQGAMVDGTHTVTVIVAFVDKNYPPQHSFVDGMLATVVPRVVGHTVRLYVSRRNRSDSSRPVRYIASCVLPVLFVRRGLGRWCNFAVVVAAAHRQIVRQRARGQRAVLFVRNDPVMLLAAAVVARGNVQLVFQSSYPHEEISGQWIKRAVARGMFRLASPAVDSVLAVSPVGVERLRRLFPGARRYEYIPLLAGVGHRSPENVISGVPVECKQIEYDSSAARDMAGEVARNGEEFVTRNIDIHDVARKLVPNERLPGEHQRPLTFVYSGQHNAKRRLGTVLRAIREARRRCGSGSFVFLGGDASDVVELIRAADVKDLVEAGHIVFLEKLPRDHALWLVGKADVGLSVAPPDPVNREMSPTKLAEYMEHGLAVMATRGIPLQEQFVRDSEGGVLVEWSEADIADKIVWMIENRDEVRRMGERARRYADQELRYTRYSTVWERLTAEENIGPESRVS